jgi:16S rRNA processing protein RimM
MAAGSASEDTIVVGRIGRPHGVKGEVSVEPRTDEPDRRFATGAQLKTKSDRPGGINIGGPGHLTVTGSRWHSGRLLVAFDPDEHPADPEEFYDHQLVGLAVVTTEGHPVGVLREIVHGSAQDLLVITADGPDVLVPFVSALVPEVDVAGGRIVVADLPGLLSDLD